MNLNKLNRIVENIVKQIENKREHFVLEESEEETQGVKLDTGGKGTRPNDVIGVDNLGKLYTKFEDLKNDIIYSNLIKNFETKDVNL